MVKNAQEYKNSLPANDIWRLCSLQLDDSGWVLVFNERKMVFLILKNCLPCASCLSQNKFKVSPSFLRLYLEFMNNLKYIFRHINDCEDVTRFK